MVYIQKSGNKYRVIGLAFILYIATIAASCGNTKQLQYLQGAFDTLALSKVQFPEPVFQQGDILNITVYSDNATASAMFNPSVINTTGNNEPSVPGAGTAPFNNGYFVDEEGNIQFPVIGSLQVQGLTKNQLVQLLNSRLAKYLNNPYYNIRLLNYKITLIGEVNRPGVYSVPSERVNILEALGLAGDLTFFAKKDNILIVREFNGKREFGRIDLGQTNVFESRYYYLKQNDIVVVDMTKRKIAANDQVTVRNISIITSVISTMAIVVSLFR